MGRARVCDETVMGWQLTRNVAVCRSPRDRAFGVAFKVPVHCKLEIV